MMAQDMLTYHHNLRTHVAWDDVVGVKLVDKSSMSVGSVESRRRTICDNQPRIHHRRVDKSVVGLACIPNLIMVVLFVLSLYRSTATSTG